MSFSEQYNGFLLVDKPRGLTSHDVVGALRKSLGQKSIGHTGTLDPLATGLMLVCLGKATKLTPYMAAFGKTYLAEVRLGLCSQTYDAEGIVETGQTDERAECEAPDFTYIQQVVCEFVGQIEQTVPAFSAVKVKGHRLYTAARQGKPVETPVRKVEISTINIIEYDFPFIRLLISCSKGTYIRSLAHDIGQRLGCGAYLSALRRTRVGHFELEDALSLDCVSTLHTAGQLSKYVLMPASAMQMPSVTLKDAGVRKVRHGIRPKWEDVDSLSRAAIPSECCSLVNTQGEVVAVARIASSETNASAYGRESEECISSFERVLIN